MIRPRLAELTTNLRDLPRLFPIACRGAIAALVQDSLGGLPAQTTEAPRARPGDSCGAVSQGVPTPTDSLRAVIPAWSKTLGSWRISGRRTSTAEGERAHPGSESPGVLARVEEPPRGVPATVADQFKRRRDALELIAGCDSGRERRCLDELDESLRTWRCSACVAADALTDRGPVAP